MKNLFIVILLFTSLCLMAQNVPQTIDYQGRLADSNGNYPPPPLNGTAHAWHHDISVLKNTIQEGGVKLGGTMPPFKDKLSTSDIEAVIAYFQSKWPDRLYQQWDTRNQGSNLPTIDIKTES